MMKSKNQNNKKRRSTFLKKIVGQEVPPGCIVVSVSDNSDKGDGSSMPPRFSIGGGNDNGSSWPLCWCVNKKGEDENYCFNNDSDFLGFSGGRLPIVRDNKFTWDTFGYLNDWSKFINIDQTDENGNNIKITLKGGGYLFYYMNDYYCGINGGKDQGLAEVVLINKVSEINATSKYRLNTNVPRLSNFIMELQDYGPNYLKNLTKLILDEELIKYDE